MQFGVSSVSRLEEFRFNELGRRDIKDIKADLRLVRETLTLEERKHICEWLESTNPSSNHNNAWKLHEDYTGLWMSNSPQWKEWINGKKNFLWVHGIPGAAKTVLASFLVQQVQLACNDTDFITEQQKSHQGHGRSSVVCVYYYCYFARNQDEAVPFLQWLVGQLCRRANVIPSGIYHLFQLSLAPTVSQLLEALENILKEFATVFVLVDAVDESQPRLDLLKVLRGLATDHRFNRIRLLATSREYYDIQSYFSDISVSVSMKNPLVEDDIRRYVHSALASNPKFHNWPPNLLAEVESALAVGAKGM